ncbi:MAG TPA: VTT domain-containing protein [Thermoanaerobaculia bacterium]|nr:VTT domain-containing protein [Thermoanaerobaculia bacterium]
MTTLVHYLVQYGVALVFLNVFLEQIGAPVPALPTLIVAGALARDGKLSSTHVLVGAVAACLIADWLWFVLGRRYGYRVLRTICRISLSPDSCVRDTEANFERWGLKSLLFAKFIPGFSTVAPPLAGATRHRTLQFLLYDGLGAILWAGAGVAAGRAFHRAIDRLLLALERLGWWAVVFVILILALIVLFKWWQRIGFYRQLRMARITVDELRAMIDGGQAPVVLDVRTPSVRKRDPRRIPTAIVTESAEIDLHIGDVPPHKEIVLYCT